MLDELSFTTNPERIQKNFDALLRAAAGTSDPSAAWSKWIKPGQRVGIKISSGPGRIMGAKPALIEAIVQSLIKAGIPGSKIVIFDRYAVEMQEAGWTLGTRPDGVSVTATWPQEGYDPQVSYSCPYVGRLIWGDLEFKGQKWDQLDLDQDQVSRKSYYSNVVTQRVDAIIGVSILTCDRGLGVYGCIANVPLGVIDNQRRFFKPFFAREENIADLAGNKALKGKWVLNVVDATMGQFAAGPPFDPKYVWPESSLWLSEDPVALDSLALALINDRRPKSNITAFDDDTTAYLKSCEALGIGSTDLGGSRIRKVPPPADGP